MYKLTDKQENRLMEIVTEHIRLAKEAICGNPIPERKQEIKDLIIGLEKERKQLIGR